MAGSSRATQEALLREVYFKDFRRQFNVSSVLLQAIRRNTKNYAQGKQISVAVHSGAGTTYRWTSENRLPDPDFEQVARAVFSYKMMTSTIQIAGDFKSDAGSAKAADVQPLDLELRSTLVNMRTGLNFDLFGDGSGQAAEPVTATSSTVLTVDNVAGLRTGMRVDILLTATGAVGGGASGVKVNVNRSTKTLTLTESQTMADFGAVNSAPTTYGVYRAGSRNKAISGLQLIVDDGAPPTGVTKYGGIDRTLDANDFWRSFVDDNSGSDRTFTDTDMAGVMDQIATNSDGSTNLIICHHDIWNSIVARWQSSTAGFMRREIGQSLNGWAETLTFNGVPIVRDKHCPIKSMFFLDTRTFSFYQNNEGAWMDDDGAILARVPGFVAYSAAWWRQMELVCTAPIANGVLSFITP